MMQYQKQMSVRKVFSPIKINKLEIKNRILMPAMHMNYTGAKGEINDKFIAFYEERAKGGVGLIIFEHTGVPGAPGRGQETEMQLWRRP